MKLNKYTKPKNYSADRLEQELRRPYEMALREVVRDATLRESYVTWIMDARDQLLELGLGRNATEQKLQECVGAIKGVYASTGVGPEGRALIEKTFRTIQKNALDEVVRQKEAEFASRQPQENVGRVLAEGQREIAGRTRRSFGNRAGATRKAPTGVKQVF